MFEYVAVIRTPKGLALARAGFDNMVLAEQWIRFAFDDTNHAGYWEIQRNGEIVVSFSFA